MNLKLTRDQSEPSRVKEPFQTENSPMTRFLISTLLLVGVSSALAADLDTILDKNAQAHGGAAAYESIQSIRHQLHIKEPTFEVEGTYFATRDDQMRIDIYAGEDRVFAEGLFGGCAWEWTPGQSAEELGACVGETATAALRHGIEMPGHFHTLKDVRDRGAKVELIGEVEIDTGSEWQVRLTLSDGFSRDYFIDQKTYRLTRARDHRAFHPGVDPTEVNVETRYEAPEFVDGVLRFKRQVNVNTDTGGSAGYDAGALSGA